MRIKLKGVTERETKKKKINLIELNGNCANLVRLENVPWGFFAIYQMIYYCKFHIIIIIYFDTFKYLL